MTPIKISQAVDAIRIGYKANVNVLLTGGPRIGKTTATEIAAQELAKEKGLTFVNYHTDDVPFRDEVEREQWWRSRDPEKSFGYRRIPVPLWDLGLTMGIPMPDPKAEGSMQFLRPNFIPDFGQGLLCLDELTQADKQTQKGFLGLLWERQAGDHRMASGWGICATGNRMTDRAGVEQLISPIRGRLQILEVEPDIKEWLRWHQTTGKNPIVRAYHKWRDATGLMLSSGKVQVKGEDGRKGKKVAGAINVFYGFDPQGQEQSYPSPGTWDMVSRTMDIGIPTELELPVLSGMVGMGVATDFVAFIRTYQDLPTIEEVRQNPTKCKVPEALGGRYAMMLHLAQKAELPNDLKPIITYIDRVAVDLQVVCMQEVAAMHSPGKLVGREWSEWAQKHIQLFMEGR